MANDRPRLGLDPVRNAAVCPVHPSHQLALVGGAAGSPDCPTTTFAQIAGLTMSQYLRTFARAFLFPEHPGPVFPLNASRLLAEPLCRELAPRPLILLGRSVAMAFQFPSGHDELEWVSYRLGNTLCCAAVVYKPTNFMLHNDYFTCGMIQGFVRHTIEKNRIELGD